MEILLPALAIAFVAFCIWLGVRIINRREQWAKWLALGLAVNLPVLYVLSFGPVCWVCVRAKSESGCRRIGSIYAPLLWLGIETTWAIEPLEWYMWLGAPDDALPYLAHDTGIGYRIGWRK
jgi:hypothetical protein